MAKMTMEQFVSQLRAAFGDDALRAVVLYGSAAGGEHHAEHSDLNVLLIVHELQASAVVKLGAVVRAWREAGNPAPLTLTEAEWRSSVDVFAMEHADMQERNKVLFAAPGYAPFTGRLVKRSDVRHQLEFEAMATLLRVRTAMLEAAGDGKQGVALLAASISRVQVLFRALVRLAGDTPPVDRVELCRMAAARAGFSPDAFVAAIEHRRGAVKVTEMKAGAVLEGYHAGLERVVAYLDALPDEV